MVHTILCGGQLLLIAAKLFGYIDISWTLLFIPTYCYIALVVTIIGALIWQIKK